MRGSTLLMLGGAILCALSFWLRDALPEPQALQERLRNEPVQAALETGPGASAMAVPFQTKVGGVTYTVTPRAEYEIWGLVVSRHDTDSWWDWIHQAWNDHLNVVDLCVVFAENVERGGYVGLNYSSGQFVCYVQTGSSEKWQRFSMRALSNNHVLADRPDLVRKLRGIRVGDQVRLRGVLAEYAHNQGLAPGVAFMRGTSLTRDDTGNGACETLFVQDVEVLQSGGGPWRVLIWVGAALFALGFVFWLRAPFRVS